MGIVKKFNEWINESYSSVRPLTNNIYQTIVDAGLGSNFNKPKYNDESPWLTAQADTYDFEITNEVDCIPFSEGSTFDYDKYIFYGIYITDETPINDGGDTASVIIEYGEDDYTDGPEPWVLYYSAKTDHWDGSENGPIDGNSNDVNPDLLKLIATITPIVNPRTKFTAEYLGFDNKGHDDSYASLDDENCSVENLYNYLIDHYESLGDEKIEVNSGKQDGKDWHEIHIPITLSGENIETEPWVDDCSKIWAIDFSNGLMKYVEDMETVVEIDDENINDDGYSRAYTSPNTPILCSEVVDFLDELLGLVPNPALRRL